VKIIPTFVAILILTIPLSADDFRFMALSHGTDPSFLLNDRQDMEENYLLSPWPWDRENTPFSLNDELTDMVFNQEGDTDSSFSPDGAQSLFFERLHNLWNGRISLSFRLSEELLNGMDDPSFRRNLIDRGTGFPADEIIWDPHLSSAREDYNDLEAFLKEWDAEKGMAQPFLYSMGRQEKSIPFLWEKAEFVIIEAYDFSGRHSTLENAEEAVENFILRRGRRAENLILGIPLYGRKYKSSDPEYWIRQKPYSEIVDSYNPEAGVNEVDNYYFNGPLLAREKTEMALAKKMGGIALYPIEWDSRGSSSLRENIESLMR
jgi:hypothetical protein